MRDYAASILNGIKARERMLRHQADLAESQSRIRDARQARFMPQWKLAALVGVSQPTICYWENGNYPADWDRLCAVLPELEEVRSRD